MAESLDQVPEAGLQNLILSFSTVDNRKVAYIAARVSNTLEDRGVAPDNEQFGRRFDACLAALVDAKRLKASGNIQNWRHSEVCLNPKAI
jgi:hypothetical protein